MSREKFNIIYLDRHNKSVTGGHKYNDAFEEYLEVTSQKRIINEPQLSALYSGFSRLYAPFVEIKRARKFHNGDVVFWSDSAYIYHLILLLVTKVFKSTRNVCIIHHFLWIGTSGIGSRIRRTLMKIYYSLMDYIIVPSPYTKVIAEKTFPRKNIVYVPLPFEKKFEPSDNFEVGNLLFVGTIEPRKGLKYLLEAMTIFERHSKLNLKLNVVGKVVDLKYKDLLDEYIENNNLNVRFLGRVSNEDLDECYRKAEIFAFPSLLEGYGIVLVEAMQRGLPIVCFNNSAMPYSVFDGVNGFLVNDKDPADFARKLLKICDKPQERLRIQEGIKQHIAQIKTSEDFHEGIRRFWEDVVK